MVVILNLIRPAVLWWCIHPLDAIAWLVMCIPYQEYKLFCTAHLSTLCAIHCLLGPLQLPLLSPQLVLQLQPRQTHRAQDGLDQRIGPTRIENPQCSLERLPERLP